MSALQSGVSGMLAHQTRMDAIGNNIANANTIGFKSTDVHFADAIHDLLRAGSLPTATLGGTNPASVGLGVMVTGTDTNFAQGSLISTGRSTDIAVQGEGMLAVTDGKEVFYTRDGALGLDANGNLIHLASGLKVVGLPADAAGNIAVSPAATLRIPLGQTLAKATANVQLGGNLDAGATPGAGYDVTFKVYDSLGAPHDITLAFSRPAADGTWDINATSPDGTVTLPPPPQLAFDANGKATVATLAVSLALTNPNGAAATVDMNVDTTGITQQAAPSTMALQAQDGIPPGTLTGVSFDQDGTVLGIYSNGLRSSLGQLPTATFTNLAGLEASGHNLYRVGANSGAPVYGVPGADGRGALASGQLENSNVNLAQEFADMIVTQRGFQANSRVVTAADQMLQELMNTAR